MANYASWAQQQQYPVPNNYMSLLGYSGNPAIPSPPMAASPTIPMQGASPIAGFNPTDSASSGLFPGIGNWLNESGFLQQRNLDGTTSGGWGTAGLGILQGLGSAYMGMKQYGLAKDAFAENKRQFGLNYDAQRTTTNSALEDRQRARVASNTGAYESVGSYMDRNRIK